MKEKINVAVVGAGFAGNVHLKMLTEIENVTVKAVCDANPDIAGKVADRWKIKSYTDVDNLLDNEDLDMVTICTPPNTHYPLSEKAVNRGVHVLIEKPLADSLKDAEMISNALRYKQGVKLGVVHNLLFSKAVRKGKEFLDKGRLGRLISMIIVRTCPIELDKFALNKNHWCHRIPGGRVCEALPHKVYLVQEFLGDVKVNYISAKKLGDLPWLSFDELYIVLESDLGQGSIYWSRNVGSADEFLIFLFGTKGVVRMNLSNNVVIMTRHRPTAERIAPHLNIGLSMLSEVCQSISGMMLTTIDCVFNARGRSPYYMAHKNCIQSFINSILSGTDPYVGIKKGYICTKITTEICDYLEKLIQERNMSCER